jgi:hypothetical protein
VDERCKCDHHRGDQNSNSSFLICELHALIQGGIVTQPERARKAGESRSD